MAFPPSAKWSTDHLNRCNQLWPARPCPVLGTRQLLKVPEPFLKWPLRYALLVQDRFSGVRPRQPCSSRWGVATPALLYFTTCSTTNFHHTIRRVFVPHQTGPRCQPAPASASQRQPTKAGISRWDGGRPPRSLHHPDWDLWRRRRGVPD